MSLERFVAALERAGVWVRPRGDHLDFRCPIPDHDDSNASGSADWKPPDSRKPVGRVVFVCHACGEGRNPDLIAALGLSEADLYDDAPRHPDLGAGRSGRASSPATSTRPQVPPAGTASTSSPRDRARASDTGRGAGAVDKSTPPKSGPTRQTTYLYRDAQGREVLKKLRLDPVGPDAAERRKTFRWQHRGGARGGWQARVRCEGYCAKCKVRFDPEATQHCPQCGVRRVCQACQDGQTPTETPLYRLPEVLGAARAGGRVWVCEGEKDADAVAAVLPDGQAATSAPSTAWRAADTEALAGAAVTVLADRDEAGYKRASTVAAALAGAGCEVAVRRTPLEASKADAADHLAAGLDLGELEDVPAGLLSAEAAAALGLAAPAPADEPADDPQDGDGARVLSMPTRADPGGGRDGRGGSGSGGGGGGSTELPVRVIREHFEARPDGLYERKIKDGEVLLTELLDVKVRLEARVQANHGDDSPPELSWVDLVASRDGESVRLTQVTRERWEKCQFLADLPWPARYEDTAKGRSKVRNAISATSGPVPMQTCYTALGWQEIDERQVYVHAGGGIDRDGPVELWVRPPDPLAGFVLPAPPDDPAALRAAVHASTALLDVAPGRLAAPLLGGTYRALLGFSPVTLMPVGAKGTGKTALAAFATQHFAPGARSPDDMPNIGGNEATGGTVNALSEIRYGAGDMLCPVEDIAPDAGISVAARRSAELLRGQFNRLGKNRLTRDMQLRTAHRPRGTLMITAEESPSVASAESRALSLKVNRGDLRPKEDIGPLDRDGQPEQRAALTAAMVRHVAERIPMTDWLRDAAAEHTDALSDPEAADPGVDARQSSLVAETAVGWQVMLEAAVDGGALTQDEADALWARVWEGLVEAKQYLASGLATRTPEQRVRELLRSLLIRSEITLSGRFDEQPADPDRCGWSKVGDLEYGSWRQLGPRVGWTDGDHVWLHPASVFPLLDKHADGQQEPLNTTKDNLAALMAGAGAITTRHTKRGPRFTVSARVGAARSPLDLWEMSWQWLWAPDDEDDDPTGPDGDPPPPSSAEQTSLDDDEQARAQSLGSAGDPVTETGSAAVAADAATGASETGGPDPEAAEAAAAEHGDADEPVVIGVDGPVRFAPGHTQAACRHCGRPSMFVDPLGPVHPMCALSPPTTTQDPSPTAPGSPAALDPNPDQTAAGQSGEGPDDEATAVDEATPDTGPCGRPQAGAQTAPPVTHDPGDPKPDADPPMTPAPAALPGTRPPDDARPWPRPGSSGRWQRPAAVLDTRGVFLPDGTQHDLALRDLAEVLAAGDRFDIGHPSGPGLLIVTEDLCDQLGTGGVVALEDTASEDAQRRHILDSLAGLETLLAPARAAGWHIDGDQPAPHMRCRRGPQGDERVLSVLLEPFQWVWDPRGSGLCTGTEDTALPAIEDPVARWSELARRAGRITELLEVQFPYTAALVGQAMFDQEQAKRRRKASPGGRRDRAGRRLDKVVETAQELPELAGHRHGRLLEPPLAWNRPVSSGALEQAQWLHGFDIRKQFLPAFNIDLGFCGPDHPAPTELTDPETIAGRITGAPKPPFGLWRVAMPGWDDPRLPAPHPYQGGEHETRVWITSPTLRLLLGDEDAASPGVGYSLEALAPDAAWVWPEQGRLFDGWVKRLREAINASRSDPAVTAHLKAVFAGYRGRMLSSYSAGSAHHQPAWAEAILAAARAEQWRKIRRAALDPARPVWPSLISADEVVYLAEDADPAAVAPMPDTGKIGEFSYRRSLRLDDEIKARIREHGHNLKLARVWTLDSTEPLGQH